MILSGGETANSSTQASVNTADANRAVATHRFHLGGCEAPEKKPCAVAAGNLNILIVVWAIQLQAEGVVFFP